VKLLSATPTETLELITGAERCELEAQLRGLGEDGMSERCFVEAALEELKVCVIASWYNFMKKREHLYLYMALHYTSLECALLLHPV
jgi:hypothetical protein